MHQRHGQTSESNLDDLLGTYLHVSARFTPPSYSLRSVAIAFNAPAAKAQPQAKTADTLQPCGSVGTDLGADSLNSLRSSRRPGAPA